jgi:hypothetical protein
MNNDSDWYPGSLSERVDWHVKLDNEASGMASKYGWDAARLASIHADRLWLEHWAGEKLAFDAAGKQLTGYLGIVGGNKTDLDKPVTPAFSFGTPPAEVLPGIEARARELRREAVGRSFYSKADGLLLGFERPPADPLNLSDYTPSIGELKPMSAYRLQVFFAKNGVDAHRFEGRFKGGEWFQISDESESPAVLQLPAQAGGAAAQIEIRSIGMKKYKPVGHESDIKVATIAP